jgi:hypothetical protein
MQQICPISHIPLRKLRNPVAFRQNDRTVYEAEHAVRWLRHGRMVDPATNFTVCDDMAFNILIPVRLEKTTDEGILKTETFLKNSGYLDGSGEGQQVIFFRSLKKEEENFMNIELIRSLVSKAVWISQNKIPVVAAVAGLIFMVLSTSFCITTMLLFDEITMFMCYPTLEHASELIYFFIPITFASACYLLAYAEFLRTVLIFVVIKALKFLMYSIVVICFAFLFFLWFYKAPQGKPPFQWLVCSCAQEYSAHSEYNVLITAASPWAARVVSGFMAAIRSMC